jgi:hypothetical protein
MNGFSVGIGDGFFRAVNVTLVANNANGGQNTNNRNNNKKFNKAKAFFAFSANVHGNSPLFTDAPKRETQLG